MEKTILRTPQQNGVAECMNKTLNERARSIRLYAGLPKTFWADLATWVVQQYHGPQIYKKLLLNLQKIVTLSTTGDGHSTQ